MKISELVLKLVRELQENGDSIALIPDPGCGCCSQGPYAEVGDVQLSEDGCTIS